MIRRHISEIDLGPYKAEIDSEWVSNYRSPKSRGERSSEQVKAHVTQGKYGEALLREAHPEMVRVSDANCHKFLTEHPCYDRLFLRKGQGLVNWEYNDLIDTERKLIVEVKTWNPVNVRKASHMHRDVIKNALAREWLFADEIYFFGIEDGMVWLDHVYHLEDTDE